MTKLNLLVAVILWLLSAIAVDTWLLINLMVSKQPGSIPAYGVPTASIAAIACLLGFAASLRKQAGRLSIPAAAAFTFLGCIPVWLIMESTII